MIAKEETDWDRWAQTWRVSRAKILEMMPILQQSDRYVVHMEFFCGNAFPSDPRVVALDGYIAWAWCAMRVGHATDTVKTFQLAEVAATKF